MKSLTSSEIIIMRNKRLFKKLKIKPWAKIMPYRKEGKRELEMCPLSRSLALISNNYRALMLNSTLISSKHIRYQKI